MQKKRFLSITMALVIVLSLLAGCSCQHEWKDANCRAPKTCKLCNETEGEKTDDHKWEDATTEAPKTCTVCGKTEGEKINVDARFKTANCKEVFGTWRGRYEADAAQMGNLPGTLKVAMKLTMSYSNDGKLTLVSELEDKEAFLQEFTTYLVNLMYQQFAAHGMNKAQADAACTAQYGMDVNAYCTKTAKDSIQKMATTVLMVYYVEDGKIYAGNSWDAEMDPENYEIKDGKLYLDDTDLQQTIEFTKVTE